MNLAFSITDHFYKDEYKKSYIIDANWPLEGQVEVYMNDELLETVWVEKERVGYFEMPQNRDTLKHYRGTLEILLPDGYDESDMLNFYLTVRGTQYLMYSLAVRSFKVNQSLVKNGLLQKVLRKGQKLVSKLGIGQSSEKAAAGFVPVAERPRTTEDIGLLEDAYYLFCGSSVELEEGARFEITYQAKIHGYPDVIYSDSADQFKPDFNLELLRSYNYIGECFAVKKSLLDVVGLPDESKGDQMGYDFLLRCAEKTNDFYHIPQVLYKSACKIPDKKEVVQKHYNRINLPVLVEDGYAEGTFHGKYQWEEKPLISIIIPNKDHIDDLSRCIDSLSAKSVYPNYEIIVVENNSTESETWAYYEQLQKENPRVKVVTWDGPFNYSAINNFGARYASGEYYLLLNNDIEVISPDCLEELLGYCMQEDVGAVGARLYFEDDTIQHAGVIVGLGGIAGHAFTGEPKNATGYMNRICCVQEYSAVTAACLLVKRSVFEKVNGLNEELSVAFNDIDFCLKIQKAGYRVVYNPFVEMYHYESKSRGAENTPEKVARFHQEIRTFENNWNEVLRVGDPHYNVNFTIDGKAFEPKH